MDKADMRARILAAYGVTEEDLAHPAFASYDEARRRVDAEREAHWDWVQTKVSELERQASEDIAAGRTTFYASTEEFLASLDGSAASAVTLLTGLSRDELNELGGLPDGDA
jgi:hypothetical protein